MEVAVYQCMLSVLAVEDGQGLPDLSPEARLMWIFV